MNIQNILVEAKLKAVLKTDSQFSKEVLDKINSTGLKGEELYDLKKTVLMQKKGGIDDKKLINLVDDYMKVVNLARRKKYKL